MAMKFTEDNFKTEVLNSNIPVLVDFYADWCGPCKMMAPIVDELAGQYEGKVKIGKLNVDEAPMAAGEYRVMNIPTFLVINNGEAVERVVGAVSKAELEKAIEKVL